jgi:uncharacterized protein YlxW (UPF0749 family)
VDSAPTSAAAVPPQRTTNRWRVLVPVVCLVAGFGFAVSARFSHGADLRAPGTANLVDLVRQAEADVRGENQRLVALQAEVSARTARAARSNAAVAAAARRAAPLRGPFGLTAVHGPGLEVVLDDAPSSAATAGVDQNQLLVHQSDLQAVVNALWAGGADAVSVAGQRLIPTSAVRCVGPTLLLNGEVFSPPYRVDAIGPAAAMQKALAFSPGVRLFQQAAEYYGLGYTVATDTQLHLPAYRGTVSLAYASPAPAHR